jgi:hypothetical protein
MDSRQTHITITSASYRSQQKYFKENMASTYTFQVFLQEQVAQQYPINVQQLAAFETLFSNNAVPVPEISEQIMRPYVTDGLKEYVDTFPLRRTIFDTIEQFTVFNDKLVELVTEIQKVPRTETREHIVQFHQTLEEFRNSCKSSLQGW